MRKGQAISLGVALGFLAVWSVFKNGASEDPDKVDSKPVSLATSAAGFDNGIPIPTLVTNTYAPDASTESAKGPKEAVETDLNLEERFDLEILNRYRAKTSAKKMVRIYSHAMRLGCEDLKEVEDPSEAFRKLIAGVQGGGELVLSIPQISEEEILQASEFVQFIEGGMQVIESADFDEVEEEIDKLVQTCENGACERCVRKGAESAQQNRLLGVREGVLSTD